MTKKLSKYVKFFQFETFFQTCVIDVVLLAIHYNYPFITGIQKKRKAVMRVHLQRNLPAVKKAQQYVKIIF